MTKSEIKTAKCQTLSGNRTHTTQEALNPFVALIHGSSFVRLPCGSLTQLPAAMERVPLAPTHPAGTAAWTRLLGASACELGVRSLGKYRGGALSMRELSASEHLSGC